MQTQVHAIECTECANTIQAAISLTGQIVDCDDCGAELEIVSLWPIEVQLAPELEEDWGE